MSPIFRGEPAVRHRVLIAIALLVLPMSAMGIQEGKMNTVEPNLEIAKTWWPEMAKKWTVVGWPEHIARFNVLFDGTILSYFINGSPATGRAGISEPYAQFSFFPAISPDQLTQDVGILGKPHYTDLTTTRADYGDVVQGWDDSNTPVLWSEWAWHGYLLREQVFAHVPGGQALKRGDEPLFAWVRLSVHYASPGLPLEKQLGFAVRINGFNRNASMEVKHNLSGTTPKYARDLKAEGDYQAGQAFRILEPDGRVRIAVAPGVDSKALLKTGAPTADDSVLYVQLPPNEGAYVDLLIPMAPADRAVLDKELALGYDGAFKEAEAFWSATPASAARFDVPEDGITQAIRRNLQVDRVTAEKDPATGDTYVVTAGFWYGDYTWATPVSIAMAGFLDPMGYHDLVARYLKPFKENQGKVTPPGESFKQHPGYLEVPQRNVFLNWLTDHGAILWVMAQHGLLTGDKQYIEEYTPVIVKACEWIRDARRIKGHGGVLGVMPPAGSSDDESRVQNCWSDGWIYKGLTTAVEFLKATHNPRAAEFEAEAQDYRATFRNAFRTKAETMPTWPDDSGKQRRFVPFSLSHEKEWQFRHLFYLDTGPMQLVFAGLMDADDEGRGGLVS